jgi:hypothetical protein
MAPKFKEDNFLVLKIIEKRERVKARGKVEDEGR